MRAALAAAALALLAPAAAAAQDTGQLAVLGGQGAYDRGDSAFLVGSVAAVEPGSYVILQVSNPRGDLCRVQQIEPIPGGAFVAGPIPMRGAACGAEGPYEARLFYGGHSARAGIEVTGREHAPPGEAGALAAARGAALARAGSLSLAPGADASAHEARLSSAATLAGLEAAYAAMCADLGCGAAGADPAIRPAVAAALDAAASLAEGGEQAAALEAAGLAHAAELLHAAGDGGGAASRLAGAFAAISAAAPGGADPSRPRTFAELEASVQSLMSRTGSVLSAEAREELARILSRGTAPVHAAELAALHGLLTEARYLDAVSGRGGPAYATLRDGWAAEKERLLAAAGVGDLLDRSGAVSELHSAALMLRGLDAVGRFVGAPEGRSGLALVLAPEWEELESDLAGAPSAEGLLEHRRRAADLSAAAEISSRISRASAAAGPGVGPGTVAGWDAMLGRAADAGSLQDLLAIVSEFEASVAQLREARSPLHLLRFEYESLRPRAELQADHASLFRIDTALRVIGVAEQMASGSPSATRIDRIELLLASAEAAAPEIRARLDSYTGDAYRERAEGIFERARSLENLVELGLSGGRFLPGYADFAGSVGSRLGEARALAVAGDLDGADSAVRALFSEWQTVSAAYADDPFGSERGYSLGELEKIRLRERVAELEGAADRFGGAGFDPHRAEHSRLAAAARDAVEFGSFADAEARIAEMGEFLEERLAAGHERVIYDISPGDGGGPWTLSGFLDKRSPDRQEVRVTVYDAGGAEVGSLEFYDTRGGEFSTAWRAPEEPGLYVAELEWQGARASRLVYVPEPAGGGVTAGDPAAAAAAGELAELESFAATFGGSGRAPIAAAAAAVRAALAEGDARQAASELAGLREAVARHLPERSRLAVVEASYSGGALTVAGAVQKEVPFGEDLYVDVYDQRGERALALDLRDDGTGRFGRTVQAPLEPGTYVARLTHHGLEVTDFFSVPG